MLLINILLSGIMLFSNPDDKPKSTSLFIAPLKIPVALSANFGELRIDHFHSGIDIKTQGAIGKEVLAASDGFIYRISVSPSGFGKALYIRHPSGYSTVYGHLDRFAPEIEKYVTEQQYQKKSFMVNLYPANENFEVRQGQLIAYSGNSGSSMGPHLHYEIRKSDNEGPVNPLLFEPATEDNIPPVIQDIAVYPLSSKTFINGRNHSRRIDVSGSRGNYDLQSGNEVFINGPAGFGIRTYDLLNSGYNKCGVYSIKLCVDSVCVFRYVMDGFSFDESRFINSHIDYEAYMRENIYIQRMYALPNDKLGVYKDMVNRGIFNFNDNKVHYVNIVVTDINDNKSVLNFKVKPYHVNPGLFKETEEHNNLKVMPYNKTNRFIANDISVSIPGGALYDTLFFDYKREPGTSTMLSDVHVVHNKYTPLHKPYKVAIKPQIIIPGKESKMLIAMVNENNSKIALNSQWEDDYLTTEARTFGNFCVSIDTIPPVISSRGLTQNVNLTGRSEINFRITDDFSGIKSYEPYIDGKWAMFEYDAKYSLLSYRFDPERIQKGTKHKLILIVTDNSDNKTEFKCDFTW